MAASQSSFGAQTYGHGEAPDRKTFWFGLIAVLGCFVLFIAVMFVAYLPPNSADSSGQAEVVQARLTRLEELRGKEATAADNYSWANQPEQIMRIPIARAMALLPAKVSNGQLEMPALEAAAAPAASDAAAPVAEGATPAQGAEAPAAAAEGTTAPATPAEPAASSASPAAEGNTAVE